MPLPTSAISSALRKARSATQGFGDTMYHGTTQDVKALEPGGSLVPMHFMSPSPELASRFTGPEGHIGGNVMPVRHRAQNTFDFRNPEHMEQLEQAIDPQGLNPKRIGRVKDGQYGALEAPEVTLAIKELGFDSFNVMEGGRQGAYATADRLTKTFSNTEEGKAAGRAFQKAERQKWVDSGNAGLHDLMPRGRLNKENDRFEVQYQGDTHHDATETSRTDAAVNTAVFDPSMIRSVNADFDPTKYGGKNLIDSLLPVAATGTLGAAALRSPDVGAIESEYVMPRGDKDPNQTLLGIAEALRAGDKRLGPLANLSPLSGMANVADKMAFGSPRTFMDWFEATP